MGRLLLALLFTLASFALAREVAPLDSTIQKNAEAGDAAAQYDLAMYYKDRFFYVDSKDSKTATEDIQQSEKWLRKSAEQGYVKAESTLAFFYDGSIAGESGGYYTKPNYLEALKWFLKADEDGDKDVPFAINNYCMGISAYGNPIPEAELNFVALIKRLHKAADQGIPGAWGLLGIYYENGKGTKQDYVEAEKWLILAVGNDEDKETGDHFIKDKAEVESKLTSDQIKEAHKRAQEWLEEFKKRGPVEAPTV